MKRLIFPTPENVFRAQDVTGAYLSRSGWHKVETVVEDGESKQVDCLCGIGQIVVSEIMKQDNLSLKDAIDKAKFELGWGDAVTIYTGLPSSIQTPYIDGFDDNGDRDRLRSGDATYTTLQARLYWMGNRTHQFARRLGRKMIDHSKG